MSKQQLISVAVGLAIVLLTLGCGGGGDSTSSATISKAEFVKQANTICEKTHEEIQSEFQAYLASKRGNEPTEPAAVAAAQREVAETILIPAKQREAEGLRELTVPRKSKNQIEAILKAFEESIGTAKKHPEKAVINGVEAFGRALSLATKYGLSSTC